MVSEPNTRRHASEDAGPQRRWIVRSHIGWRGEQVSARTLGPEGGWIVRSYIGWRWEQVSTRTLGTKGGRIVRSHIGWGKNETLFIKMWKLLHSRRVLKTLRENPKGRAQGEQYLLRWAWVITQRVPTKTLDPEGEWIVRSHIGWGGERNIFYKGVETSP